jgi:hypothetical protein
MKLPVIIRSFQKNADRISFSYEKFKNITVKAIDSVFNISTHIIVVINADKSNIHSEKICKTWGTTPSETYINRYYTPPSMYKSVHPINCTNWGRNIGSATALNEGLEKIKCLNDNSRYVLILSPELKIEEFLIDEAIEKITSQDLDVVGFYRECWGDHASWQVPQNTGAIWKVDSLMNVGGFAEECNGDGKTIQLDDKTKSPIAGMEDYHAMIRMMNDNQDFKWGMVGEYNPVKWDVDFRDPVQIRKINRQGSIMKHWAITLLKPHQSVKTECILGYNLKRFRESKV